jgi:multidrug efflux pump subunit AcrB
MSLLSIYGILALCGVVINDSLILVSRYNELRAQKMPVTEALVGAGSSRLRAIFLTSLTTFVGLYPLLQETSAQAQILIPTAVSLAYGIVFATLNTLILIPILLRIREDLRGKSTAVINTTRLTTHDVY